jgi:hypothetical protein
VALLKDLDHSVLLLGGAELSLEGALGGRVVGALVAVPVAMSALLLLLYVYHCIGVRYTSMVGWLGLLVGDEDLEAVDDLGEGHALVLLPLLNGLGALDEDNEVLALALVVALGLGGVSAHVGCCGGWLVWVG